MKKLIFIVVIGTVAATAGWYAAFAQNAQNTAAPGSSLRNMDQFAANLVALINQLKGVKLDDTLLSDPIFTTLRDFGTRIEPENVGRPNPFAPIGAGGVRASTTPAAGAR